MNFIPLENAGQLNEIKKSKEYSVIFKHNTTCPISKGVHSRLEAEKIPNVEAVYLLDLLAHRDLSDAVAADFGIQHESPQLLLIKDGRCVYNEWGYDISADAAAAAAKE